MIGEMAHVIGRSAAGPRGVPEGGADTYDNLILLCPTHHTHIDKAPGEFPEDLLRAWKTEHEGLIRNTDAASRLSDRSDLCREVSRLLAANKIVFETLGPRSERALKDPASNLASVWQLRRIDRIVPNNRRILNVLDANAGLLTRDDVDVVEQFRVHAEAYEHHVYERVDDYPQFPQSFTDRFAIR